MFHHFNLCHLQTIARCNSLRVDGSKPALLHALQTHSCNGPTCSMNRYVFSHLLHPRKPNLVIRAIPEIPVAPRAQASTSLSDLNVLPSKWMVRLCGDSFGINALDAATLLAGEARGASISVAYVTPQHRSPPLFLAFCILILFRRAAVQLHCSI
ncbi:hypothetical protein K438DRAFT_1851872, partial [Mycena galopus ATCC 62051]